jgi:hypothetical protein
MGPSDWLKKYKYVEFKSWEYLFYQSYSIKEPKQVAVNMPEGIKRKSIFYELLYWKDILIYHLLYPMHIFKNVPNSMFRHISSKEKGTLSSRRDISLSCTKFDRIHFWLNKENETYEEAPWILKIKRVGTTKKCHPFNKDTY